MNAISLLRNQMKEANDLLEATMADVTSEQAHWIPPGIANPLGSMYAHAVMVEDATIHKTLRGGQPLWQSLWKNKTGVSAPQMHATLQWARDLHVDLAALRLYAQAVYAATDAYLATLQENDLERTIDLTTAGLGRVPLSWILNTFVVGHTHNMTGEISCLKGLQGARGYPT
jgi:hypothetical protein